jgi:thiamine biosynthesis lipoprotein
MNGSILSTSFEAFDRRCEFVTAACTEREASRWLKAASKEIARIQAKFNVNGPESMLGIIQRQAGKHPVACDRETMHLLRDGAADTAGLELGETSVRLTQSEVTIDIEHMLPAFALDSAAKLLKSKLMRYGYLSVGAETRFLGAKPGNSPWYIGIQHPDDPSKLLASVPMYAGALSTTLSGASARSAPSRALAPGPRSVTVIADTAFEASQIRLRALSAGDASLSYLQIHAKAFLHLDEHGNLSSAA